MQEPPPAPTTSTAATTTVPAPTTAAPRECLDPATLHSFADHGEVTVWYANDRGIGPYPVGVDMGDGCIEPYAYWRS